MKSFLLTILFFIYLAFPNHAQTHPKSDTEKEVVQLSMDKWQWMADKDISKLTPLFHPRAKFVHMSGTWTTARELEIIETGSIWYKKATVHDTAVELVGNTAIVWNRITLESVVRGNDAKVEFTVTEVYQKESSVWKMLAMTFSSVRDMHQIEK
ncbi:nuclear transport factor 2 family protein [Fontibacter flavus]|uniref:Nuclear transport factor 2 family protein n=1 Tax=Fontibacter flavus TaxID=654838 RepID=A0ABV6FTW4_9BACT